MIRRDHDRRSETAPEVVSTKLARLCLLMFVAFVSWPSSLVADSDAPPRSVAHSDKEGTELSVPFLTEPVILLEDGQGEEAAHALEQAIARYPDALPLRLLRQSNRAAWFPLEVLARPEDASPSGSPADRFEWAWGAVKRIELERDFYRGDQGEAAADFIARVEARAEVIGDELGVLLEDRPGEPWILFVRARLAKLFHRLDAAEALRLWDASASAGAWTLYLRSIIVQRDLIDADVARQWLDDVLGSEALRDSPIKGRLLLSRLQLETRGYGSLAASELYAAAEADFPNGPFRDDFSLSYGQVLAHSHTRSGEERALALLAALVEPPFRNTTFRAAAELGELLDDLRRHSDEIALFERFHQNFPSKLYRFDRRMGRALAELDRLEEAEASLRRSIEGPQGRGTDYLFLADVMRRRLAATDDRDAYVRMRAEALTLSDFASAALKEEVRVRNWARGRAPQMAVLQSKVTELVVLAEHAMLFPLSFVSGGMLVFVDLMVVGLALMSLVSYPRLLRHVWRPSLIFSVSALVLPLGAIWLGLPDSMGIVGNVFWLIQSETRLFFTLAGSLILASALGQKGVEVLRPMHRLHKKIARFGFVRVLGLPMGMPFLLAFIPALFALDSRLPTPYLERLPSLLIGTEAGIVFEEAHSWSALALRLFHGLQAEILSHGILFAVILLLVGRRWAAVPFAIAASTFLYAFLQAGMMEPTSAHVAVLASQGLVLGWLRWKFGLDTAVLIHAAAVILTHFFSI